MEAFSALHPSGSTLANPVVLLQRPRLPQPSTFPQLRPRPPRASFTSSALTSLQASPSPQPSPLRSPHPSLPSHPSSASFGFLFPHVSSAVRAARRSGALDLLLPLPYLPASCRPGRETASRSPHPCALAAAGPSEQVELSLPRSTGRWTAVTRPETWRPRASEAAEPPAARAAPHHAAWLLTAPACGPEDPRCGHHSAVSMVYSSSLLPAV